MTNIDQVRDRNRAFAETDIRQDVPAPFLPRLRLYIVSCIDCRIDPAQTLGIGMGEALIQRNLGGRVTPDVIRDIAYTGYLVQTRAPQGPWFEVAVIHHTECGSGLLADGEIRRRFADHIGVDERTLADTPVLDPAHTVRTDVRRLMRAPEIPPQVRISGHIYDLATGLISTVVDAESRADSSAARVP